MTVLYAVKMISRVWVHDTSDPKQPYIFNKGWVMETHSVGANGMNCLAYVQMYIVIMMTVEEGQTKLYPASRMDLTSSRILQG